MKTPLQTIVAALLIAGCGGEESFQDRLITAPRPASIPMLSTDFVVSVNPGVDASEVWSQYALLPQEGLPDGLTFRVRSTAGSNPEPILTRMNSDSRVAAAELNLPVIGPILRQSSVAFNEGFPTSGAFFEQALAQRLELGQAHTGSRGYGIKIAILDTGIDLDHPVLASRILPGSRDFLDIDFNPSDLPDGIDNDNDGYLDEATGHGTHVAGLVALVAPSARIMALRVLNSDGVGNVYGVAAAIEYAVDRGVRVINMSIGLTAPSPVVEQALGYAAVKGVILVTAAGNNPGTIADFPSNDSRVWPVAAVDGNDRPAPFTSSFAQVVVSAPGVSLQSTYWDGSYAVWSGTSMAAPIVAGTAALILAQNPSLTPEDVLRRIQATAKPFKSTVYGMGAGVVSPGTAVGNTPASTLPGLEQAVIR